MANCAYLYSLDNRPVSYCDRPATVSGLSKWSHAIPISYRILASCDPQLCVSLIADGSERAPGVNIYAISAAFWAGYRRFLTFIDCIHFIARNSHVMSSKLIDELIPTRTFLDLHANKYVLLETVELNLLANGDLKMQKELVKSEISMCKWVGEAIDALPEDTIEAAAIILESSVKGQGPFAGLRFDDEYDTCPDPIGLYWNEKLHVNLPNRTKFDTARRNAQPKG